MTTPVSLALQSYSASKPITEPAPGADAGAAFRSFAQSFSESMLKSEQTAMQSITGDVNPHALVQSLAQTELAVETVVTVRDKVVQAYQEIMRMPV